jgi:hypothetical protein
MAGALEFFEFRIAQLISHEPGETSGQRLECLEYLGNGSGRSHPIPLHGAEHFDHRIRIKRPLVDEELVEFLDLDTQCLDWLRREVPDVARDDPVRPSRKRRRHDMPIAFVDGLGHRGKEGFDVFDHCLLEGIGHGADPSLDSHGINSPAHEAPSKLVEDEGAPDCPEQTAFDESQEQIARNRRVQDIGIQDGRIRHGRYSA